MISSWSTCHKILHILMFITSFGEQNITYKCCSNFLIHLSIKLESQIYQYLIDKLQCHAKDILFIGDTLFVDYSDPNEFGMSARLIDRKNGQKLADFLIDIL